MKKFHVYVVLKDAEVFLINSGIIWFYVYYVMNEFQKLQEDSYKTTYFNKEKNISIF